MDGSSRFSNVGHALTQAADTYKKYKYEVYGYSTVVLCSATSWNTLSPWAAVPVIAGSITAAIMAMAKKEIVDSLLIGAVAGGLGLLMSGAINESIDPSKPNTAARATLDKICWAPDKKISTPYFFGKPYEIKINNIFDVIKNPIVPSKDGAPESLITHEVSATESYNYHTFWTGALVEVNQPIYANSRSGPWRKETETVTTNGKVSVINCAS